MTTSTLNVGDLFSVLEAQGIEKQLGRIAGVGRVSVNPVSGSTTVAYDPAKTSLAKIKAAIKACGFHCAGEALPKHVCEAHTDAHEAGVPATKSANSDAEHKAHNGEKSGCGSFHAEMRCYPTKAMASVVMVNATQFDSSAFRNRVDRAFLKNYGVIRNDQGAFTYGRVCNCTRDPVQRPIRDLGGDLRLPARVATTGG